MVCFLFLIICFSIFKIGYYARVAQISEICRKETGSVKYAEKRLGILVLYLPFNDIIVWSSREWPRIVKEKIWLTSSSVSETLCSVYNM